MTAGNFPGIVDFAPVSEIRFKVRFHRR